MNENKQAKIVFLGNGVLAECAMKIISRELEVVFWARTREDLRKVREIKQKMPEIHGVLASFGVMIKPDLLELFEPEGILNIHPSLLPKYRGASPIESAILDGCTDFSVSVMKLVQAMDAGPVYFQATLTGSEIAERAGVQLVSGLVPPKEAIYKVLAETGAEWIASHLASTREDTKALTGSENTSLLEPVLQDDSKATFCGKLDKSMSLLTPETDTAEQTLRKIVAFAGFPKAKYVFYGQTCIIHEAHILDLDETAVLALPCADGRSLGIDRLQPEGKRPMDAKSFLNGYKK